VKIIPAENTTSTVIVNPRLFAAVLALHEALTSESNCDYAYTICLRGHVVAMSNIRGVVTPRMEKKS
jgi:hypothetical protein